MAHYLDASALVKLVDNDAGEERGRHALRKYYEGHTNMYATSLCFFEALSTFKRKSLQKLISEDQYIRYVNELIRATLGWKLRIDEVPILSRAVATETERLIKTYKIDFVDCFQIVTILHGTFCRLGPRSKSILITADRQLASAAREEGARVWEITTEPAPQ